MLHVTQPPGCPRRRMIAAMAVAIGAAALPATAQPEPVGPALGAASNLSQGQTQNLVQWARDLGVEDFRDGTVWARSEPRPGAYDFSHPRAAFPEALAGTGADVGLVLNWGNPLYDNGDTPHSPEAVAAFGRFAGALVAQFPGIDTLEIGNEFNSVNFVRGPLARMDPLDRAEAYVPLLRAAALSARAVRPEIRISGGATHSLPAAYLWRILDAGGADVLDTLAVHPYTTPADQLVRQVAVVRRHPAARDLPLEITEFGHPDPDIAASHLLRNYCQMALSGAIRAVWYPLNERGDGLVPLFTRDGRITGAGRAYRLAAAHMEDRPVRDAVPDDPFAYGCLFGADTALLWGEARDVTIAPGVEVLGPEGQPLQAPFRLDPVAPLLIRAPAGAEVASAFELGPTRRIADSFHNFAYPEQDEALAPGDAFARFARRGDRIIALQTLPGQEVRGTPWFPYRGNPNQRPLRLTAEQMVLAGSAARPIEIVHRYTAPAPGAVDLDAVFAVADRSADGVVLRVDLNGAALVEDPPGQGALEVTIQNLMLAAGDQLDIVVAPGDTPRGDLVSYRIVLERSE